MIQIQRGAARDSQVAGDGDAIENGRRGQGDVPTAAGGQRSFGQRAAFNCQRSAGDGYRAAHGEFARVQFDGGGGDRQALGAVERAGGVCDGVTAGNCNGGIFGSGWDMTRGPFGRIVPIAADRRLPRVGEQAGFPATQPQIPPQLDGERRYWFGSNENDDDESAMTWQPPQQAGGLTT